MTEEARDSARLSGEAAQNASSSARIAQEAATGAEIKVAGLQAVADEAWDMSQRAMESANGALDAARNAIDTARNASVQAETALETAHNTGEAVASNSLTANRALETAANSERKADEAFQVAQSAVRTAQEALSTSSRGISPWTPEADYRVPVLVFGEDNLLYEALRPSGPNMAVPAQSGEENPEEGTDPLPESREEEPDVGGGDDPGASQGDDIGHTGSGSGVAPDPEQPELPPDGEDHGGEFIIVGPKNPVEEAEYWKPFRPDTNIAYKLCEFYAFRHPEAEPGFAAANGALVEDAALLHPEAWEYLLSEKGRILCISEEDWLAMSAAEPWLGIGGVPFFVIDEQAGTLRLPDLRGMYMEAAGFDGLGVGGVHGDAIRNLTGVLTPFNGMASGSGVFQGYSNANYWGASGSVRTSRSVSFDAGNVVPTAAKNQPRAWGANWSVYLGGA